VFVDTLTGALSEAGDILSPLQRGVITEQWIKGEMADLVLDRVRGRTCEDEITVFKSVGTAISDIAAGRLFVASHGKSRRTLVSSHAI
jgi:ornithine cyclodeaminase/alanine dehydrogenase-like protein (mu-crystallin family)